MISWFQIWKIWSWLSYWVWLCFTFHSHFYLPLFFVLCIYLWGTIFLLQMEMGSFMTYAHILITILRPPVVSSSYFLMVLLGFSISIYFNRGCVTSISVIIRAYEILLSSTIIYQYK